VITKDFVLAGRAVFTVESPEKHWTYRVKRKDNVWFVGLLTGPDNASSYTYLGMLHEDGTVHLTAKSKYREDSKPVRVLRAVLKRVWVDDAQAITAAGWDVNHEGKCGCCGRALTTPMSCLTGIGPVCRGYMPAVKAVGMQIASLTLEQREVLCAQVSAQS
jgi:hypothetical protein